jgi:DNA-binding MarR family transcriptional regulator
MRSQYEQQDPLRPAGYRDLQLLSEVVDNPEVTQRQLSRKVGIALGLTNVLLRNLMQKGYIRVSHATWKRRLYTLTPEGFSHRIRLTVTYVYRVLDHYKKVRHTLGEQLEPLALNAESRVAIYGTGEFAELVYLGLRDIGIEEIDVFAQNSPATNKFLGMPVRDLSAMKPEEYDRVVVAILSGVDAVGTEFPELKGLPDKLVTFFRDGKIRERV